MEEENKENDDTFKIFIATDNHLGYSEEDTIRGEDSFNTFEEILVMAKEEKSDMLLLGGDLFHHNKPSRPTMYRTMNLFRKYCQGGGPINFRIVSDQSRNFPDYGVVNFEDPNINVELPVFSIHGNHDDPVRDGFTKALSSLDLLSCARLINYFGQTDRVDDIEVFPILMMKGKTKVAIYGLGNVRDERLNRMFAQQKVKFRRPAEWQDEWFSIFVVHQNRDNKGRGSKNCVHESFIPEFIDFVLWGHEHECLAETTESLRGKFVITQPGSSVATSLVEGEAREKKVGLLEIRGGDFRWTLKPLKTVRPFIFEEIVLSEQDDLDSHDPKIAAKVSQFLSDRVRSIIASNYDGTQQILVRLRIEYTGFVTLHNQQFGSQFVEQVANPDCILQFHKTRKAVSKAQKEDDSAAAMEVRDAVQSLPNADAVCVEALISQVLQKSQNKLELVPENDMNIALESYVYKGMASSVEETITGILESTQEELSKAKEASTSGDIIQLVEKTMGKLSVAAKATPSRRDAAAVPDVFDGVSKDNIQVLEAGQDMFDAIPETTTTSKPMKRRTISRKKKAPVLEEEDDDESDKDFQMEQSDEEEEEQKHAPRRTTTAKRKASAARVEKVTPKKRKQPVRKRAEKENKTKQSTIMAGFESQQSQSKRKLPGFISSQRSAIEVEEIDDSD